MVILKGVCIEKNSIIGASSLVLRDVPENVIVGGVPAMVIKRWNKVSCQWVSDV